MPGKEIPSGRERYCKDGFRFRDGLHGDGAAVGFRDLADHRKPQAGPVFLIGDKRIEDRPDPVGGNAAPGIPADDGDAVPVSGQREEDGSCAGRGVTGVLKEIQDELLQFYLVPGEFPDAWHDSGSEFRT